MVCIERLVAALVWKCRKHVLLMQQNDVPSTYAEMTPLHKATGFAPSPFCRGGDIQVRRVVSALFLMSPHRSEGVCAPPRLVEWALEPRFVSMPHVCGRAARLLRGSGRPRSSFPSGLFRDRTTATHRSQNGGKGASFSSARRLGSDALDQSAHC